MQVLLSCTECPYQEVGTEEGQLMNKIIIWNHVKKEHPQTAERIMRLYQHVPSSLFNVHSLEPKKQKQPRFIPRYA